MEQSRVPASVDRETLFNEVWSEPVRKLARRYSVSDVALAKVCRRMGIPLPPRGHWAKVAAGHTLSRPSLPSAKPGQDAVYRPQPKAVRVAASSPVAPLPMAEASGVVVAPITIPASLSAPHPMIRSLRTRLGEKSHFLGQRGSEWVV
jgi:hypothetical protein